MLFAIIGHDGPEGAALRPRIRPAHLDNLRPLVAAGRVVIAGPFMDGTGSLIVAEFANEAEANAFAESDPYTTGGVFNRIEVKLLRRVFPE